jgi:hypothetical protein
MPKLTFTLNISAEEYLQFYRGTAASVLTVTESGRQLQFPAAELRPYVSHTGIRGRFEIEFDDQHKLQRLTRLGD